MAVAGRKTTAWPARALRPHLEGLPPGGQGISAPLPLHMAPPLP